MNGEYIVAAFCLCVAVVIVGWMIAAAINDFVLQPRRDARGRVKQWCSGCDSPDVMTWDMAWTEDHGRYWCANCRKQPTL